MVPVKKCMGYMMSYRKYVENMHTKMRELNVAQVEKINAKVENFPSEVLGCLELKSRHTLGRRAFKISEEIKSVMTQSSLILDGLWNKFMLILDDVWKPVELEDIGLSRLPNQGVDFKALITSRDQALGTEMGVKANSVFKVRPPDEVEAQSLFHQFWGTSELHKIGEDIVRKCSGLPIAIKTMACTLTSKSKVTLKNALARLKHYDIVIVAPTVFKTSYDNLQDAVTEATFLLDRLNAYHFVD